MKNICSYICRTIFCLYVQKGHRLGRMQLYRRRKSWGYRRFHSCGAWPSKLEHDFDS